MADGGFSERTPLRGAEMKAKARKEHELGTKVIFVGDAAVGKTSLIRSFCDQKLDREYKATIGVDITTQIVRLRRRKIMLFMWDVAGQKSDFATSREIFYRGAKAVIVVYAIDERASFENVAHWLDEINLFNDQYVLAVVGNKRDRPEATRTVSEREGRALASEYGAHFVESSALTGENVQELFHHISGGILDNFRVPVEEKEYENVIDLDGSGGDLEVPVTVTIPRKGKGGCCSKCTLL